MELSDFYLFIHLRMSGDLYIKEEKAAPEKHDRLILTITPTPLPEGRVPERVEGQGVRKKKLVFNDTRKFGRVWLAQNPDKVIGGLGPEPLSDEFTAAILYSGLQSRRRQLKPLLLDQSFLAGMGNIYTDEALHRARLHPLALSDSIKREQARALWEAIREVLQEGIRRNGASIDWVYRGGEFQNCFRVYDRAGQPCLVCSTEIERIVVGQRGTHVCPTCQRIGS
jgi:formamidopyrimidine-DNA glycosylase